MTERLSRRALFDALRFRTSVEKTSPVTPRFSLDSFYQRRQQGSEPAAPLPVFQRQGSREACSTTRVGSGPDEAAPGREVSHVVAFDGTARVRRHSCLAWRSATCSVCVERCPVPGAVRVAEGRPTVDESRCTGCGICVSSCPAPINGFDIVLRKRGAP